MNERHRRPTPGIFRPLAGLVFPDAPIDVRRIAGIERPVRTLQNVDVVIAHDYESRPRTIGGSVVARETRGPRSPGTDDTHRVSDYGLGFGPPKRQKSRLDGRSDWSSNGHVLRARSSATSAMPALAEQLGHARTRPPSSLKTRANWSETCALQWSHCGMVRSWTGIRPTNYPSY